MYEENKRGEAEGGKSLGIPLMMSYPDVSNYYYEDRRYNLNW